MLFADHPPSEHPSSPLFRAAENCSWRLLISYPRFFDLLPPPNLGSSPHSIPLSVPGKGQDRPAKVSTPSAAITLAPTTPAILPSSPMTIGRFLVASGSDRW